MSRLQTGIAHVLDKRPDTPVIPVLMRNLGFSLPRGDLIMVPLFCDVFIGRPRVIQGDRQSIMQQLQSCFDDLKAVADRWRDSQPKDDDR
jgi:hypothetical protein